MDFSAEALDSAPPDSRIPDIAPEAASENAPNRAQFRTQPSLTIPTVPPNFAIRRRAINLSKAYCCTVTGALPVDSMPEHQL